MSEWNEDFDALVSALREREPTPEDQRRIRAKLEAASVLAVGTGVLSATLGAQASTELGLASVAPKAFLGAKLASVAATPKLVLVAAAISVGAAPVALHLASQSGEPADKALVEEHAEMGSHEGAARSTVLPPSPTEETLAARDEHPPQGDAGKVPAASPGPQPSASLRRAAPPFASSESLLRQEAAPRKEAAPQLKDETALLEQALGALRRGDLTAAQTYLAQHERMFPRGALSPERERTRARIASLVSP